MALYKGNQLIEELYFGSTEISRLYKGGTLVFTNKFEKTITSDTTLTLKKGTYSVCLIGGGGQKGGDAEGNYGASYGGIGASGETLYYSVTLSQPTSVVFHVGKGGGRGNANGGAGGDGARTGGAGGSGGEPSYILYNGTLNSAKGGGGGGGAGAGSHGTSRWQSGSGGGGGGGAYGVELQNGQAVIINYNGGAGGAGQGHRNAGSPGANGWQNLTPDFIQSARFGGTGGQGYRDDDEHSSASGGAGGYYLGAGGGGGGGGGNTSGAWGGAGGGGAGSGTQWSNRLGAGGEGGTGASSSRGNRIGSAAQFLYKNFIPVVLPNGTITNSTNAYGRGGDSSNSLGNNGVIYIISNSRVWETINCGSITDTTISETIDCGTISDTNISKTINCKRL